MEGWDGRQVGSEHGRDLSTACRPSSAKMSTRAPPAHVEDADKVMLTVQSQGVDMSRRCKQLRPFRDKALGAEIGMAVAIGPGMEGMASTCSLSLGNSRKRKRKSKGEARRQLYRYSCYMGDSPSTYATCPSVFHLPRHESDKTWTCSNSWRTSAWRRRGAIHDFPTDCRGYGYGCN